MHRHLHTTRYAVPPLHVSVPVAVFLSPGLSPLAMAAYGWLAAHLPGDPFPFSYALDEAFDDALDELVAAGFIELEPLGPMGDVVNIVFLPVDSRDGTV